MERNNELRLAVLIDAENVPSGNIKEMMEEIAKYGIPTFKRIYADWTKPQVNRWKTVLLEHAITPIQQFSYTQGKNASDSAMIIDAMDILYTGRVDGFCIISSDSDFTRLALRLREAGMRIIGMGEKKTPKPFIVACDKFIYIEILGGKKARPETEVRKPAVVGQVAEPEMDAAPLIRKVDAELIALLSSTVSDMADEAGWAFLGEVGNLVLKKKPDFDSRNYGYRKLAQLVKSTDAFEMDERLTEKGNIKHVYIRVKPIKEPIKDVTKATTKEPSKKGIKKSVKNVVSPTLETGGETAIAPAIATPKKSAGKPSVKSTPAKDETAPEKEKVAAVKSKEKAVKKSKK